MKCSVNNGRVKKEMMAKTHRQLISQEEGDLFSASVTAGFHN